MIPRTIYYHGREETHMTVICYGGLFDSIGRWMGRGFVTPMKKKHPNAKFIYLSWTDDIPDVKGPCIVVCHSFGIKQGRKAAIKLKAKLFMVIDGRMPPMGSGGVTVPSWLKTRCIYQTTPFNLRGYPVEGAITNMQVAAYGHTAMPWHPLVHSWVSEEISAK